MTGGEKAIGDVAVKGIICPLGERHTSARKSSDISESHYYGQLFSFSRLLLKRVIFDIILTVCSSA